MRRASLFDTTPVDDRFWPEADIGGAAHVLCVRWAVREQLQLPGCPKNVKIDLENAHFWDLTAVDALDRVVMKLR